jgi:cob(I)alamin adenosyltransferase
VIDEHMVKTIENEIDNILGIIPPQKTFILPGGTEAASIAHICRTICRRAERRIYAMADSSNIDEFLLEYINRLSDYLYVFARKLNFISGEEEKIWQKTCK